MSKSKQSRERYQRRRQQSQPLPEQPIASSDDSESSKNWDVKCMNCNATPTVGDTELCGPCCFGEAETMNGNW